MMGDPMTESRDQTLAALQELDLLSGELSTVRGQLEELATMWRRQCVARNSWLDMPHAFPQGLLDAAGQLDSTLRALAAAGPGQAPELASSAAGQLAALDAGVAAAVTGYAGLSWSTEPCAAAVRETMNRARARQQALIAHLASVGHWPLSGAA
jgi:hypothetical protein